MDQVCQEPCLGQAGGSGWMLVRPAASRFLLCRFCLLFIARLAADHINFAVLAVYSKF